MRAFIKYFLIVMVFIVSTSGSALAADFREIKHYPLDSVDGVIAQSAVTFDQKISSDGNGSIRITAEKPLTVRLFETGDIQVENARLIYSAKIRTEDVQGKVYLEMWCGFLGKGEFFARALHQPLSGTNGWSSQQTPFFLQKGQNPDNVKLNLVIEGTGTVWIDDILLTAGPLK